MAPDLSFLAAFANNPITLAMLLVAGIVVFYLWKVGPNIVKPIRDLNTKVDNIILHDELQDVKINNNMKDCLRFTIYSPDVAIEDRLVAYKRYVEIGGNGKTSEWAKENLIKDNEAIWDVVCKLSSSK
jgi:hypothetical protein